MKKKLKKMEEMLMKIAKIHSNVQGKYSSKKNVNEKVLKQKLEPKQKQRDDLINRITTKNMCKKDDEKNGVWIKNQKL